MARPRRRQPARGRSTPRSGETGDSGRRWLSPLAGVVARHPTLAAAIVLGAVSVATFAPILSIHHVDCETVPVILTGKVSSDFIVDLSLASRQVGLETVLAAHSRLRVALALALCNVEHYFAFASSLFVVVGNLRFLGSSLRSGCEYPFLAQSFLELWRRANLFVRDAAMTLFYYPALGLVRRWLSPPLAAALSTALVFVGLVVLHSLVEPATISTNLQQTFVDPSLRFIVPSLRYLAVGLLTMGAAYRATRRGSRLKNLSWQRRAAQVILVQAVATVLMGVFFVRILFSSWADTLTVVRYALGL